MTRTLALALSLSFLAATGCDKPKLVAALCREDSACPDGYICEDFQCLPAAARACTNVIDGNPILQPDPYTVNFGTLDHSTAEQVVTLRNIGNCTLTLFEASLAKPDAGFTCEFCDGDFPIEIFPGRAKELTLGFTQKGVGEVKNDLKLLSDDKQFAELLIPIRADYLGEPKLKVTPNPIDFGYIAQGRQGVRNLSISNQGTGVATITVKSIAFSMDTMDFVIATPFTDAVVLSPNTDTTSGTVIPIELRYTPRSTAKHNIELVITTDKGETRVPIAGNAETPPKFTFTPAMINLGNVPLGTTGLARITMNNEGGAPLNVTYAWGGPTRTTDLFAVPNNIPPIAPGTYTELQVGFTATALGPITGLLVVTTNDPAKASITIPVSATGIPGAGPEVVKVEMTFENGSDSAFDDDIRNVDMTLEHPFGYVCNKAHPAPNNWGSYGNATWLAFPPKEEPERIVLADTMSDGTFRVQLQYLESCKSVPSGLVAGILGITVDALVTYYSGGAVPIDGEALSGVIERVCLSRSSTSATVKVSVNGTLVKEKTITMGRKGDAVYALDVVRNNAHFTVP